MFLFKPQKYEEVLLPFEPLQTEEDNEAGLINIRAYGDVLGEFKSCHATYALSKAEMYDNGDYDALLDLLKDHAGRKVNVLFKIRNGKIRDFKIDLSSLVCLYRDDRFYCLDLLAWGLHDI